MLLKGVIKKSGVCVKDWDRYLKYLLFSYCDTLIIVTGYCPFEVMYGRHVCVLLDLLTESRIEGDYSEVTLNDWVLSL